MNKEKVLLVGVLVLIVGVLIFSFTGFFSGTQNNPTKNQEIERVDVFSTDFDSKSTGTTSSGDVSIELTPHEVSNGQLEVDIAVNTHSVDLTEFDLIQITTLEFEEKIIKPISGPQLKGHHSSGTMVFNVENSLESFTIKISGIPKVDERVFTW